MTIKRFARCARSRPAIVAAVTLWVLVPALAAPTPSAAASSRAQRQWLDPKAGWHGRRIMQPKREAAALAALPATLPSGWPPGPSTPPTAGGIAPHEQRPWVAPADRSDHRGRPGGDQRLRVRRPSAA